MAEITLTEQVSVVTLSGIPIENESRLLSALFSAAAESEICIDMISKTCVSTDTTSIGFTFNDEDMAEMLCVLGKMKFPRAPMVSCGNVKITVKSDEMVYETGFAAKLFCMLKNENIIPLLVTTAVDEISAVVRNGDIGNDFLSALTSI